MTPFHWASSEQMLLLSALGVDENAVNFVGHTALVTMITLNVEDKVNVLLKLNVDTSNIVTPANARVGIVRLLDEHRSRTV